MHGAYPGTATMQTVAILTAAVVLTAAAEVVASASLSPFEDVALSVDEYWYKTGNGSHLVKPRYKLVYTDAHGNCLAKAHPKGNGLGLKQTDPCAWYSLPNNVKYLPAFLMSLSGRCRPGNPRASPLTADVAANAGKISVALRAMGCRVLSVEPQPDMVDLIQQSLAVNGWRDDDTARVHQVAVGNRRGTMTIPTYNVGGGRMTETEILPFADLLHEDLQYLSLDIDGFDGEGLQSLLDAMRKGIVVRNIAFEMWACHWHRYSKLSFDDGMALVDELFEMGYRGWVMNSPAPGIFGSVSRDSFREIVPRCCLGQFKCGHAVTIIDAFFSVDPETIAFMGPVKPFSTADAGLAMLKHTGAC